MVNEVKFPLTGWEHYTQKCRLQMEEFVKRKVMTETDEDTNFTESSEAVIYHFDLSSRESQVGFKDSFSRFKHQNASMVNSLGRQQNFPVHKKAEYATIVPLNDRSNNLLNKYRQPNERFTNHNNETNRNIPLKQYGQRHGRYQNNYVPPYRYVSHDKANDHYLPKRTFGYYQSYSDDYNLDNRDNSTMEANSTDYIGENKMDGSSNKLVFFNSSLKINKFENLENDDVGQLSQNEKYKSKVGRMEKRALIRKQAKFTNDPNDWSEYLEADSLKSDASPDKLDLLYSENNINIDGKDEECNISESNFALDADKESDGNFMEENVSKKEIAIDNSFPECKQDDVEDFCTDSTQDSVSISSDDTLDDLDSSTSDDEETRLLPDICEEDELDEHSCTDSLQSFDVSSKTSDDGAEKLEVERGSTEVEEVDGSLKSCKVVAQVTSDAVFISDSDDENSGNGAISETLLGIYSDDTEDDYVNVRYFSGAAMRYCLGTPV